MVNQQIIIREIEKSDNPKIAQMIRDVFDEHGAPKEGTVYSDPTTDQLYELFNEAKNARFFVAIMDHSIVGCCGIYPTKNLPPGHAELVKYYIHKSARGMGLGTVLFEKSLSAAKEFGYTYLYLESLPVYAKAVSIYKKLGFKSIAHPLGDSGHTTCNIWMTRKI